MKQRSEIFKLTAPITTRYLQKILPYQLVIESIALQNQQIYELQKKYIEMSEIVSKLGPVDPNDQQLLQTREKQQILQRKMFMEEALVEKQLHYKNIYEKKKNQLEQQINLLQADIQIKGGSKINIFMNLNEGILGQLLEENKGNQDVASNIKYWKDAYERSKRTQN